MSYHLDFSKQAIKDINFHKKSDNKATTKKLLVLFKELANHPFAGAGKPEQLKYSLTSGLVELTMNIDSCMRSLKIVF